MRYSNPSQSARPPSAPLETPAGHHATPKMATKRFFGSKMPKDSSLNNSSKTDSLFKAYSPLTPLSYVARVALTAERRPREALVRPLTDFELPKRGSRKSTWALHPELGVAAPSKSNQARGHTAEVSRSAGLQNHQENLHLQKFQSKGTASLGSPADPGIPCEQPKKSESISQWLMLKHLNPSSSVMKLNPSLKIMFPGNRTRERPSADTPHGTDSLRGIQKSLDDYKRKTLVFRNNQQFEHLRTTLDFYKVIRALEPRENARSFLALHKLSDQPVVLVKEPAAAHQLDWAERIRLLRSIARHTLVSPIFEIFEEGDDLYLVTLYCKNGTLAAHCTRQNLTLYQIKVLLAKIMRGILRLFHCGVVPVNLNWSKILVDAQEEPRIRGFEYRKVSELPNAPKVTRILSSFLINHLQENLSGPTSPKEDPKYRPATALNTRRMGDFVRGLLQEKFFTTALAAEAVTSGHALTPLEQSEHNEAVFKSFLKVFYARHLDLSTSIQVALGHPFLREAARDPASFLRERNPGHEAALLTLYANTLVAKGIDPEFTRFCVAAKRDNTIKSGFKALVAGGI